MEKMLVTQALDERDLLVKKINDKIEKAEFVDAAKENDSNVIGGKIEKEHFINNAKAAYQQINDLISRFVRLDAAISASNASTEIETSFGKMTVAAAISLRGRMSGNGNFRNARFEGKLADKLLFSLDNAVMITERLNNRLQESAEEMRLSILGKDAKAKDDKPLAVVDAYIKENTTELVDPIGAREKSAEIKEYIDTLLKEIDTKIKVSNATTTLEF